MSRIAVPESEMQLIGCALYDRDGTAEAFERVRPEHFSEQPLGEVWAAIGSRGQIDPTLLYETHKPLVEPYGGLAWLAELVDRAFLPAVPAHVEAVLDAAIRRDLQQAAAYITGEVEKRPGEGEALLTELERATHDIARGHASKVHAVPAGLGALDMLETAYAGGFNGVSTGLQSLDLVTGGIRQDDVWFIGARTSMGKSVFGLSLVRAIAAQRRGVLAFSLEMPLREVQARLISDIAYDRERFYGDGNVRYGDILKGRGSLDLQQRAKGAARQLASLPLNVIDKGGLTIAEIRSEARRQFRQWDKAGVERGAVLIDHIGLVLPSRKTDNKAADTADIVNELKGLAKELKAPIIALCQVNRNTEGRNDKRPTLADLNWSGAIEQIADMICLLYREAYYLERSPHQEDRDRVGDHMFELEAAVHKNRAGPITTLKLHCDVACNAVRDVNEDTRAYA